MIRLALWSLSLATQDADLIVAGRRVWTGDSTRPAAEAVALRGERVVAVGSRADVLRRRGPATSFR